MMTSALLFVFPAFMAFAAASDLLTMTISNRLAVGLVATFVPVALFSGLPLEAVGEHLLAGGLMLAVCFGLFAIRQIGGGDAKLVSATALWLGFGPALIDYLILGAISGGVLTLALLALRSVPLPAFALGQRWLDRLHDARNGVPYGITLAGSALVVFPRSPIYALLT